MKISLSTETEVYLLYNPAKKLTTDRFIFGFGKALQAHRKKLFMLKFLLDDSSEVLDGLEVFLMRLKKET